jgi:hypothetical protein
VARPANARYTPFMPAPMARGATVAICMAVRNEERCLPHAVHSVRSQTFPGIREILICVNGSTDGTLGVARALAAQDPRIRVLTSVPGKPSAWNVMIHEAHSEILAFVDGDVYLMPNAVELAVDTLATHARTKAVSTYMGRCSRDPRRPGGVRVTVARHNILSGRFLVVRRNALREAQRTRTGGETIPSGIISEDEWVRRVLMYTWGGETCYTVVREPVVLFQDEQTFLDRARYLVRVRAGLRQIGTILDPPPREPAIRRLWRRTAHSSPADCYTRWALGRLGLAAAVLAADLWVRLARRHRRAYRGKIPGLWAITQSTKGELPARAARVWAAGVSGPAAQERAAGLAAQPVHAAAGHGHDPALHAARQDDMACKHDEHDRGHQIRSQTQAVQNRHG